MGYEKHIIKRMCDYEFDQVKVSSKKFNSVYLLTDVYSIDLDKVRVSKSIQCGEHDAKYIVGYEKKPGDIIPLHIKTPVNCSSNGVSQYKESSPWKMGFNVGEDEEWVRKYVSIWAKVEELIFECFKGEMVKNGKYINPKLIKWNGEINTRFNGEKGGYACDVERRFSGKAVEAKGILRISYVYRQGSNYHPQVFLKECKYVEKERIFKSLLSDSEDDGEEWDTVM